MREQIEYPLVLPIFIARDKDAYNEMIIDESIDYRADEIEKKEEKLKAMTLHYNKAIENIVRQYPSQWLWMHDRWRL